MFKKSFFGAAAVGVLGWVSIASAATYYVVPATQSTQDGSLANPYKTLNAALSGLTLNAGDEIRVGRGAIAVSGTMNIPAGVTVRGGYKGGWGADVWSASNPSQYASAFTFDGGEVFNLGGTLDGVWVYKSSGHWAVEMDTGAQLRNSHLAFDYSGVYAYGDGVTIAGNVVEQLPGCCGYAAIYNDGTLRLENNEIMTRYGYGFYQDQGKAVVRGNKFYSDEEHMSYNLMYVATGGAHVYQNYFEGGSRSYGEAIFAGWPDSGPVIIENNNITRVLTAVEAWAYEEWWGWAYPMTIRNNVIWNTGGGNDTDGLYLGGEYPYDWTRFYGNCLEDGMWYLHTHNGVSAYGFGLAAMQSMMPDLIFGNTLLPAPPATPTASACGGKGIGGAAMKTKPIAHGYAKDEVTGATYSPNTAVHVGQRVLLNGRDHDLNGSDTESKQFEAGELTYLWSFNTGPAPVTVYSTGNPGEVRTGVFNSAGTYTFKLQVRNDNPGSDKAISDPFFVTVFVGNKVTVLTSAGTVRGSYNRLQAALDAAQSGDTVQLPSGIFKPGENASVGEDEGKIYSKTNITVKGTGVGAGGTTFFINCANSAFDIQYSSNITIRDLRFSDAQDCDNDAIYVYESTGVVVDNVAISGKGEDPWFSGYGIESEYSIVTVRNSTFEYIGYPIYGYYGRYKLENNTFRAVAYYPIDVEYLYGNGFDAVEIEGNVFDSRWATGQYDIYLYEFGYGPGPFTVRNNTFSNTYCCAAIYAEYVNYGAALQIEGNTIYNDRRWDGSSHDSYGVELYYTNASIRNNVISGMSKSGIYVSNDFYGGGEEVGVESNVIAYNGRSSTDYPGIENYGVECLNGDWGGTCRYTTWAAGNVIYDNTGGAYYQVDVRDGNVYVDPKFVNADAGNFTPASGSPLEDLPNVGLARPVLLPAPTGLAGEALELAARITFDAVPGAAGYVLKWGDAADTYTQSLDLGRERVAIVDDLADTPYYFAVQTKGGATSSAVVVTPRSATPAPVSEPKVYGVEPSAILAGAEAELTVLGQGFRKGAKVTLGSMEVTQVEVVDDTTLKVVAAPLVAGLYPVIVVNKDLGRGALAQALTVQNRRAAASDDGGGCRTGNPEAWLLALLPLAWLRLRRRMPRAEG